MTNLIAAALLLSLNPGLTEEVDSAAAETSFAGRIVVTRDGEVVLEKSYGSANVEFHVPVHHNTRFKIFSTSKQITAMAAFLLAAEGKLDLKSPASDFFESWPE